MEPVEHTTTPQQQPENGSDESTRDRQFTLGKVSRSMQPLARWLLNCTPEQKLVAVLSHVLLREEGELEGHLYTTGDIGNDLLSDWERDIAEILAADEGAFATLNMPEPAKSIAAVLVEIEL